MIGAEEIPMVAGRSLLSLLLFVPLAALSQVAPTRTWPELREAVQERVNRNAYPLTGYDKEEVREVLSRIQSLDRDEWARSWMQQGDKHLDAAKAAQSSGERAKAREAYLAAWRYYGFGAWPTQNSEGKREAHRRATAAFRAYTALAEPAIEVLRVPFEGKEITAYLQLPSGVRPAPVVMSVGGLDSYKEYVVEQYGPGYLAAGLGYLAIDMPGTGEAPIKIDVGAERMFSRLLDALVARNDVDAKRIGFMGVSWGGHWGARIGYTEKDRLRGTVSWAGPVDVYFSRDWQSKALGTREYLFDLFAARAGVYGVSTLEEFYAYGPRMSLKNGELLSKPSAPMLLVNGEKDSQVPIEDLYLLLRNGSPKEAWVNPQGGHIGRGPGWSDGRIFKEVVLPWLAAKLDSRMH
jgi:pimeloyl-ACP methyl ester carboxylesterase